MTTAGIRTAVITAIVTLGLAAAIVLQLRHDQPEEGLKVTIPTLHVVQTPPPYK